jgi:signal transduction histidine kinase
MSIASTGSAAAARPVPFWRAPFSRRAWSELLYSMIGLPLACFGFSWEVGWLSAGVGTAVTVIGLWVLAFAVVSSRWLGAMERGLLNSLLGERIEPVPPVARRPGWLGATLGFMGDPVGWRAFAYQMIRFPLAITTFTFAVTLWSLVLGAVSYPIWWRALPVHYLTKGGPAYHGYALWQSDSSSYYINTWPRVLVQALCGVALFWITPWVMRGFVGLHRMLGRALLGPTSTMRRVQDLEVTRSQAVTSSNEQLRKIERDLHDGTQARLVALAMHLGQAKEDLDSPDPAAAERARTLIAGAHQQTKETLAELRDLARGIHPAILDDGLESALSSLAARSPIRVKLDVKLPARPSATSETITYFSIAELLTNAVKHSGASEISVLLYQHDTLIGFLVTDDGRGGAMLGGGTGLAGLAARLGTVDGELSVESPMGGPTVVSGSLPLRA